MNAPRHRTRTPYRRRRLGRGVSLVELMVAMVLGLFLVGVMGMIFLGSKGTFQSQNHVSRLQESARFTVDTLAADLRMSGFRGCRGTGVATPVLNVLNTPIWGTPPGRTFLTPASFGRILNTFGRTESFGTARQIQVAVRYAF